jgi:integrase
MAGAGLRISEAMAVTEDCLRGDTLRVYRQTSSSKTNESRATGLVPLKHRAEGDYREIPVPDFFVDMFRGHVDEYGTATIDGVSGVLFPSTGGVVPGRHNGGTWSTNSTYRYHWMKALKALGWMNGKEPKYTPHDLRHFFASTAIAGGISLVEVGHWLGHKSISVTADTYGHLVADSDDRHRSVMQAALRPRLWVVESA